MAQAVGNTEAGSWFSLRIYLVGDGGVLKSFRRRQSRWCRPSSLSQLLCPVPRYLDSHIEHFRNEIVVSFEGAGVVAVEKVGILCIPPR